MAPTVSSLFLQNLFILFQLSLFVFSFQYHKPYIDSKSENTIDSGDNFTVLCEGNSRLIWKWPDVKNLYDSKWTTVTIIPVPPKNPKYKFASRIILQNATYIYTGFYECFSEGVDPSDDDLVSSIYVFVKDEEHLSVINVEMMDTIIVTQYDEAVLPCRPTSPDVDVQLTVNYEEKLFLDTIDKEGVLYRYNPHFGFITNKTKQVGQVLFSCYFVRDSKSFDQTIIMDVEQKVDSIPKPILEEISGGHTVVGQTLTLKCKVRTPTYVTLTWTTPTGPPDPKRMNISKLQKDPHDSSVIVQTLTVNNATLKDKGTYFCNVSDNQNHSSFADLNVTIYAPDEHYINLIVDNGDYSISKEAGTPSVVWRVKVSGHPKPELSWLNNMNLTISQEKTDKYQTNFSDNEAVLTIKGISVSDYGNYTLVAKNDFETQTLPLFLNVTGKPSVHIESDIFHVLNKKDDISCTAVAHPEPTISWYFKPCLGDNCSFVEMNETSSTSKGRRITSNVTITSLNTGFIKCVAKNFIGQNEATQPYYITDVSKGFNIFGFDDSVNVNPENNEVEIEIGENFKMKCGASVYNYLGDLSWTRNNRKIDTNGKYRLENGRTKYTNQITLYLEKVSYSDAGIYSCLTMTKNGKLVFKNITLIISNISKPVIEETNMTKDLQITLSNQIKFYCLVRGVPKPKVTWYMNNKIIHPSNRTRFCNDNQNLSISSLDFKDEGVYKCEAINKVDKVSKEINLKIKYKPDTNTTRLWVIIGILLIVLVVLFILMVHKIGLEKKLKKELKSAGLANFEKGAIENLNPDLAIDDQAELLPYDKKWEFPIAKLKLGKQLGSGAFGVIMLGIANGIVEGEETTTVAVKMVKKNADHTYIKALASELKIMVHLGKHLNVVNLLGACTKNVAKRELLVIVEFCRLGNLQNYLFRHRDNFIDQVDPETGGIDFVIGQEALEKTYSISSKKNSSQSPHIKYAALSFSSSGGPQPSHTADSRCHNYNATIAAQTDITTVLKEPNSDDDEIVLSNNSSIQPEWRSNYHGDYKGSTKPICTKDLLAWAFQVSRGMEYLTSRRVLHGDLAARNILLADNNVVKICDFGLAKSMYNNDNYKKKGNGPLPVKWIAVESIRDKVFSTQSDVWSFGIVLWEFFSLAKTPYPGMEADERLYNKLLDGYRMKAPEYAPKEIYKAMLDCWHAKPINRPSFSRLSERIGSLLEDTVRKHYIDLNDPYLVMNNQRLEDGHTDYLAMLSPPNFENLSSPHHYVNDLPSTENTPGYLNMNPAHIFSPRVEDDRVFSFNEKSADGTKHELVTICSMNNESDCDSSNETPIPLDSFSNPAYRLLPIVQQECIKADKDIVKTSDNNVNMPQNKE